MFSTSTINQPMRLHSLIVLSLGLLFFTGHQSIFAPNNSFKFPPSDYFAASERGTSNVWLNEVKKNISQRRFNMQWVEDKQFYRSENPANKLTGSYTPTELRIQSGDPQVNQEVTFTFLHIQADKKHYNYPIQDASSSVTNNKLDFDHHAFTIEYENTDKGIRQNVIIPREIGAQTHELRIALEVNPEVTVTPINKNTLQIFQHDGNKNLLLNYSGLKAWDVTGRELQSALAYSDHKIQWVVNVENAAYPVTIDPISTTPDWVAQPSKSNADDSYNVFRGGDINGDGYDDALIGIVRTNNLGGIVYTYLGSDTGLSITPSDTLNNNDFNSHFGGAIAQVGDVNNDGYGDVAISTVSFLHIFLGTSSGLSATSTNTIAGSIASSAGDINNDGFDDLLIGEPDYYISESGTTGRVRLYNGFAGGLDTIPSLTILAPNNDSQLFGSSVGSAGDLNGDGYKDIFVGQNSLFGGRAFAYYGSASGFDTTADWTVGDMIHESFATAVSAAEDLNGDGYSDLVISEPDYPSIDDGYGGPSRGRIFVYYGRPSGLKDTADLIITSRNISEHFGYNLSSTDINADGFDDVLAYMANTAKIMILYGSSTGLDSTSFDLSQLNYQPGGDFNKDDLQDMIASSKDSAIAYYGYRPGTIRITCPPDFAAFVKPGGMYNIPVLITHGDTSVHISYVITGATTRSGNGNDASGAFNLGTSTITWSTSGQQITTCSSQVTINPSVITLICPVDFSSCQNNTGTYIIPPLKTEGDTTVPISYIITGATKRSGLGSNASGTFNPGINTIIWSGAEPGHTKTCSSQVVIKSPLESSFDLLLKPTETTIMVPNMGDVNGDGYTDVMAWRHKSLYGVLKLFYGQAGKISKTEDTVKLAELYRRAFSWYSFTSAGDVNGDGYDDLLVFGLIGGKVYLYYGSRDGVENQAAWIFDNKNVNDYIYGVKVGDLNGDGFADVVIKVAGFKNIATVFYGSAQGLKSVADWIMPASIPYIVYGTDVVACGDVNGDGFNDLSIVNSGGEIYFFNGSSQGLDSSYVWLSENFSTGGAYVYSRTMKPLGDINGDGFNDVLIDEYSYGDSSNDRKSFYLLGSRNGLVNKPISETRYLLSAGDIDGDGFADVIDPENSVLFYGSRKGIQNKADSIGQCMHFFGRTGDVNGDGKEDLMFRNSADDYGIYYGRVSSINLPDCRNLTVQIPDTKAIKGGSPNTIYLGYGPAKAELKANVTGGTKKYQYLWSTGETTPLLKIHPSVAGTYLYSVVVTDRAGCKDSTSITIQVIDVRCPNPLTIYLERLLPGLLKNPIVQELLKRTAPISLCVNSNGSFQQQCVSPSAVSYLLSKGAKLGNCNSSIGISMVHKNPGLREKIESKFSISASPNPASGSFRIEIHSNRPEQVNLRITDQSGRIVEKISNVASNGTVTAGTALRPGLYFVEAIQSGERKIIKVVKL